jgi:tRNA nucleotidyltransferase (CCA-adding enzyme)
MQIYMVGGAVRDALLGLPVQDRDWVIVGATPEAVLAHGYKPVGKDFPVFLHPDTGEEYALARTERKTARGYRGFFIYTAPDITLEEDLARRDLTINAIAVPQEAVQADGRFDPALVRDPFHGVADLKARILRHVTLAFCEDPVRILRVARLSARFSDFSIDPLTQELMGDMVRQGEVDHLVPERVWQELSRGLMEPKPSNMLKVLHGCGALQRVLPELVSPGTSWLHVQQVMDEVAQSQLPLPLRFACMAHSLAPLTGPQAGDQRLLKICCERIRVPVESRELAEVLVREYNALAESLSLGAAGLMRLLERCDALRKPERFSQLLLACAMVQHPPVQGNGFEPAQRLQLALQLVSDVPTQTVAEAALAQGLNGKEVGDRIHEARVQVLHQELQGIG